jgi:hypothetical protein
MEKNEIKSKELSEVKQTVENWKGTLLKYSILESKVQSANFLSRPSFEKNLE